MVDAAERLVKILVGLDSDDRAENFLAVHFHIRFGASQHGWLNDGAVAATAAQQTSAGANRFFHPLGYADGVALANQRANVGRFHHGIAGLQLPDSFDEEIGELAVDRLLYENALHGDAGLAGVPEAAGRATFCGVGEIGIAVYNDARMSA